MTLPTPTHSTLTQTANNRIKFNALQRLLKELHLRYASFHPQLRELDPEQLPTSSF